MTAPATPEEGEPLLTLGERVLGGIALGLSLSVLLYAASTLNGRQQHAVFDANADAVARELDGGLGELDTLMTTIVGMHHADSSVEELVALAAELKTKTPFVTALGRYASVNGWVRAAFERDLLDSGLYAFRITELDANGHVRTRAPAPRYHPISLLEPMDPERLRLLGADLGTVDGLDEALERIVANDSSLVTTLPAHWPGGGELLLFRAAYRGRHVPLDLAERLRQSDGGYWLASDPAALLGGAGAGPAHVDVALALTGADGARQVLFERTASEPATSVLRSLYPRRVVERRRAFGEGEIVLTLGGEIGVPPGALAGFAAIVTLLLGSVAVTAAYVRHHRLARREQRRSDVALQAARERAERTLNAIDDAVFALGADRCVLHLNPAAARLVDAELADVLGRSIHATLALRRESDGHALDLDAALAAIERSGPRGIDVVPASAAANAAANATARTAAHGERLVLRLTMTRTHDAGGDVSGHILVLRDISDERRLTRRLEFQANHDALTGCTNRRWFETRLGELLDDMPASGRRHALCYLDLDQFKIVNDTNGHAAGDRLLQELTGNLQSLCRTGDTLSRLGGDEFGLLVVDADEREARRVTDRIYGFFQNYVFRHGDDAFAVRASLGLVPLDERSGTVGDVLAAADLACYAAKEGGRNGIYVYAPDDATMAQRSSELNRLPELQRALADDRFELHVQPVAHIGDVAPSCAITHFEFLLRLTGEDGAPLTPYRIIEAAERYGLMREIDRWVIARAVATVAGTARGPGRDCSFSINLSGQSAADPTLIDFIEGEYARHDVDPARIWFELTETAAISHFSIAVDLATRIRALGSKIALDDFGSGLSSFGYLKNIPVDVLKIDGQFIRHIVEDPIDRAMVRAIEEVATSMGIVTVAEFVESQAIVEELARIGIDYAQGYHIGAPCPLPEALAALESGPLSRRAA